MSFIPLSWDTSTLRGNPRTVSLSDRSRPRRGRKGLGVSPQEPVGIARGAIGRLLTTNYTKPPVREADERALGPFGHGECGRSSPRSRRVSAVVIEEPSEPHSR